MAEKTSKNQQTTDSLLKKSKALRAKSKETENKFNELKAQVDEFIHSDKNKPE
ncbi:hypothetical protein [Pedobacter xixiisoli]|uniref:Uncharacterized protein n=1 Tax=Pedobacter xixiisoli TaxID=1476464 RepID=A0A285ZWY0_9SPHI|nr:hypothetical protein [Pedobacter xixiisoli]SOD14140.1 hypothetical protein SAMN06297358_1424 [Pedobacter xixiisoli]